MAMEPKQASPMSKMDGTRLPSTPSISKNDDDECCF